MISGQILKKNTKKVNGCKILKNAYILMKLYQLAHFYDLNLLNKSFFKNVHFWTPNKEFQFFGFFGDFFSNRELIYPV